MRPFPNTRDAKFQVSTEGGVSPLWARNGRELYFVSTDNTMMAASVTVPASRPFGEPHALFRRDGPAVLAANAWYTAWDVAADGRFIMVRSAGSSHALDLPLIVIDNWFAELRTKMAAAR